MNYIKKIFILIFIYLQIQVLYSGSIIMSKDEEINLDLYILESEFSDGKYIAGDINNYGFKKFEGGILKEKKKLERRMYTFRADFYVDELLKNECLSIYIGPTDFPYNIYLNGKLIYNKGRYKNNLYNSTIYYSANVILYQDQLKYGNEKNEFAVQTYPKYEKQSIGKVILASSEKIAFLVYIRDLFNVHLIQGACIVSLLLFLYFLFLFVFRKFEEKRNFYFSLLCIFFCMSYFNICLYNDSINEIIHEKISRIGFPLAGMFLMFFILEYSDLFKKKWIKKVIIIIALVPVLYATGLTFIQNSKNEIMFVFTNITTNLVLTPFLLFSFILILISLIRSIIKNRNVLPVIIFLGFIAVIITSIKDIIALSGVESPFAWSVPYGYLSLVLSIFFTLSIEQAQLFTRSVNYSNEITNKNASLKKIMDNTKFVSKSLFESGEKLNVNIIKTVEIIENFDKSNKEIMGKIMTQFNYIETMIGQVAKRIDISNEKMPNAIKNQYSNVQEVNNTVAEVNSHSAAITISVFESNKAATELSEIADGSSKIIEKSKESIDKIGEYSLFINEVLNYLEEVTEKTNILSINASIEAANKGNSGKGFAVIANEIRNMAAKSRNRLVKSFEKIKEMSNIIKSNASFSDEVSGSLSKIIYESKRTARKINNITDLVKEQEKRSSLILNLVGDLSKNTSDIKNLFDEEQGEYEKIKKTLFELKDAFNVISALLEKQESRQEEINISINNIKEIVIENLKNADILNENLKEQDV